MIIVIAILLWMLALALVARLICVVKQQAGFGKVFFLFWCFIVFVSALLLFRPHEDIFGGEDPGSYINSGISYGRQMAFDYVDPMLSQVPVDARPLFYYGDVHFGPTKDACLWVKDVEKAIVGVRFQPAYPVLISFVTRFGGPFTALYVVPLFALFAALALAALVSQCIEHRFSGIIAFAFFILNPLVIWHGRCSRPEMIAAFFFFGGAALLVYAWSEKSWVRFGDIALGAICLGFAPMFHITAWLLVIPAALIMTCVALIKRSDYFVALPSAAVPAVVFILQINYVTDYYRVHQFLSTPFAHPRESVFVLLLILLSAAAIWFVGRKVFRDNHKGLSPVLSATFACVIIAFFVVSYFTRDASGSLPLLGRPVEHYFYLTDFKAFANMISRPMVMIILVGWFFWFTGRPRLRRVRVVVAFALLPGILLAGNINDFMMTRYFLVTIIPASVLSLTALVTILPDRRFYPVVAGILTFAIGLAGLTNRAHLVTLTEHKGFAGFLQSFADVIIRENGMLLGEYSRITAPFEHFYGIPALGLDNQQHDDYSLQELAWLDIMKNNPDKPAFFITPFQRPVSDLFAFALERSDVFQDRSIQQAYNNLPVRIRRGPMPLSMYRMSLKPEEKSPEPAAHPHVMIMDAGNMGLRRFANVRVRNRPVDGVELVADEMITFDLPYASGEGRGDRDFFMLVMTDKPYPASPLIHGDSVDDRPGFFHIADHWYLFSARAAVSSDTERLVVIVPDAMFLAEAVIVSDDDAFSLMGRFSSDRFTTLVMPAFRARWARTPAQVLVPAPRSGRGAAFVFLEAPDIREGAPAELTMSGDPFLPSVTRSVQTSKWQWQVFPVRADGLNNDSLWLTFTTNPAWDSGLNGFPSDLGVLTGYIAVLE